MKRRIISTLLALMCLMLILLGTAYKYIDVNWHQPIETNKKVSVSVMRGAGLSSLANSLYQLKLIQHPLVFRLAARLHGFQHQLKYGRYRIRPGMSLADLMDNISAGTGHVWEHITFIEGWTFEQVRHALLTDGSLYQSIKGKTSAQIMQQLGSPYSRPEGLFFPDTYRFVWGNSDAKILQMSYNKMQLVLQQAWSKRAAALPYKTSYQALIVASLIESEAVKKDEKSLIASVIVNRLRKRMRLQIDPTVLYALGKPFGTKLTKKDLAGKSAYNTYLKYGLPPTPIDMPSLSSIEAAMHPRMTHYLYYVAKGDGTHHFSSTYRGQRLAIKKYLKSSKQSARSTEKDQLVPQAVAAMVLHVVTLLTYYLL